MDIDVYEIIIEGEYFHETKGRYNTIDKKRRLILQSNF